MQQLIFNTHDIILLATIYQSILFALLIFTIKQERHQSDYFLIGFLLVQAAMPLHILINYGDGIKLLALELSPDLYRIFEIAYWLEGPLMLWYTRSLVYKNFKLSRIDLAFVTPAVIYLIAMIVTFYTLDTETKYQMFSGYESEDGSLGRHLSGLTREILRVIFSVMCLIEIRHCHQQIRHRYSNVDDIDLGWLKFLVTAFLIINVWAVFVSVALISKAHLNINADSHTMGLIGNYVVFALVSALIFFSLSRSSIFEGLEHNDEETDSQQKEDNKNQIDPLLPEKVAKYMSENKPYLANILTLDQLASQLDMSSRSLSNVINRHFKHNFFEFINEYRVEEAKRQLADPEKKHKTMIDVMADCGFNSKATFNTFFKKFVGSTPSQYRAQQLKNADNMQANAQV